MVNITQKAQRMGDCDSKWPIILVICSFSAQNTGNPRNTNQLGPSSPKSEDGIATEKGRNSFHKCIQGKPKSSIFIWLSIIKYDKYPHLWKLHETSIWKHQQNQVFFVPAHGRVAPKHSSILVELLCATKTGDDPDTCVTPFRYVYNTSNLQNIEKQLITLLRGFYCSIFLRVPIHLLVKWHPMNPPIFMISYSQTAMPILESLSPSPLHMCVMTCANKCAQRRLDLDDSGICTAKTNRAGSRPKKISPYKCI